MSKTIDPIQLFESVIGKNPDAFLYQPVYQVTESEIREFARLLAAPVVERQPVAWIERHSGGGFWEDSLRFTDQSADPNYVPVYTSPPAPVVVVLPERDSNEIPDDHNIIEESYAAGWNDCIDKIKELNS